MGSVGASTSQPRRNLVVLDILKQSGNGWFIRELDHDGLDVGSERPIRLGPISALTYGGGHFGVLVSEDDVLNFAVVGLDGSPGQQRIEIARSLLQDGYNLPPPQGPFGWHGDAFTVFYGPGGSSKPNYYTEIHCAE